MIYAKGSMDYDINLQALREMEELVPMTKRERSCLRKWARDGHDVDSNPWKYCDISGIPLNYLQAYRICFGRSSGPWDTWGETGSTPYWDETLHAYIVVDDIF